MAEILGLGVSHYPPLSGLDKDMANAHRGRLNDPDIPATAKDPNTWSELAQREWTDPDGDSFLVCRAGALSTIKPGESGSVVPVSGSLPEGVLGEVRIHQQIYARRPEIGAICRFASPNVIAVSALRRAPKIRHGFGAMFAPEVKYCDDIRLMRDDAIAAEVAQAMGDSPGLIMRGNGAVTAGLDIKQALCLAWFLEDMSRLELAVLSSGQAEQAPVYTAEQALGRSTWTGKLPSARGIT
jgi:HCOMODA/2-hydroxy-3-carboxy-muconic semialdehyde decarboxylase